ncbi:MAG: (2Fe-2S) ferredoxin domain-containing protein [Actinomycetia bacterium]|nr:(2Fe-2S) ferredoxin domain-containing protein [Actinomycetes bacterium]
MGPVLLATLLWAWGGVWLAARRGEESGRARLAAGVVAVCGLAAWAGQGAGAAAAVGVAAGVGAVYWREAAGGRDLLWLAPVGILGGLGLYLEGLPWAAGAVAGVLGAGAIRTAGGWAEMAAGVGGARRRPVRRHILVCWGPACQRKGARPLRRALGAAGRGRIGVRVTPVGCLGHCAAAPVVWVEPEGTLFTHVEAGQHLMVLGQGDATGPAGR